jgi:hypothetical protein
MSESYSLWRFDQVAAQDTERAARLHSAPPWADLAQMIRRALHASLSNGSARFGFDESGRNKTHLRAVVQFPIEGQLFDWFFNAHTGYRAQFRYGCENGSAENARLVTILRDEFEGCMQGQVSARCLSPSFDDLGPMAATVQDILVSLDPLLSKLWFCERLIGPDGGVKDLHVFRTGPKLVFDNGCEPWSSLYADESNAWIDLKGAFVGDGGLYQLKDPAIRAQGLQARGTA